MVKKFIIFFLALFIAIPPHGDAKEDEVKTEATGGIILEEVVVTASRYEEKISNVPANVTVVTEEDIKKSTAINIPDLLRTQVGVQVTDVTGNGRSFSVDLRGYGETALTNTLVLVDGRRVNQPDLSGTDWMLISLDRVKRIEVIRGGRGSVLYGDNASGGVINIITKEGNGFKAGAKVLGGSYDTFNSKAYVSGSLKNLSYALSGGYLNSNGYRANSQTEASDAGLNLNYYANDWMKLNFSSDWHKDKTGLPGAIKSSDFDRGVSRKDSLNPDDFLDLKDYYFKAGPEIYFLTDSLFKIDGSYRKRDSVFDFTFSGGSFRGDTDIETVAVSPQIILKEKIFGFNNSLTVGFDYQEDEEDITNVLELPGFESIGKFTLEKQNYGYYILDEFHILDTLSISGGYRYDRAKFKFKPGTPDEVIFDKDLYNAGINYNFYKNSYVYFGFSKSFRYPVLDEFFDFTTNTVNTDLIPQTSDDYEIGMRYYFTDTLYAHINFFRIDTDDEIFYNSVDFSNENLDGETRRDGVEVTLSKTFERVTLKGSYSYTDAEIRSGQFSGNDVPAVPMHKAALDTLFSLGKDFTLAINGIYIGTRPFQSDFSNDFSDQEDYFLLNAKLQYHWKYFTPFIDLKNITNEKYSEFGVIGGGEKAFYPSPRFNFLAGVSFDF